MITILREETQKKKPPDGGGRGQAMAKIIWRLILNSITTTAFLTILGMPLVDVAGVMLLFWIFLWLQGEVIESIVGRGEERDRSTRTTSRGRRKST